MAHHQSSPLFKFARNNSLRTHIACRNHIPKDFQYTAPTFATEGLHTPLARALEAPAAVRTIASIPQGAIVRFAVPICVDGDIDEGTHSGDPITDQFTHLLWAKIDPFHQLSSLGCREATMGGGCQHTPAGCCAPVQFGHTFRAIKCGLKAFIGIFERDAEHKWIGTQSYFFTIQGRGGLPSKNTNNRRRISAFRGPLGCMARDFACASPCLPTNWTMPTCHAGLAYGHLDTQSSAAKTALCLEIQNRIVTVRASLSPRPVVVVLHRGLIHRNHRSTDVHATRPGQLAVASPIFIVWPQIHLVRKCFSLTFHAKTQLVAIIMDPLHRTRPSEFHRSAPYRWWHCISNFSQQRLDAQESSKLQK